MVIAALGAKPRRIGGLDKVVVGQKLTPDAIEDICHEAFRQCHPLDSLIVEIEWRRAMVPVYVRRACAEVLSQSPAAA